jgi:uncharacterized protein DUF2782
MSLLTERKVMRRLLFTLLLALALPVIAADRPAGLQPLPEAPPPPGVSLDDAVEAPEVTITTRGENKVEEYRMNGKLYQIKVTPPHGIPYYLVDETGNGVLLRRDTIGPNLQPPMWVIHSF